MPEHIKTYGVPVTPEQREWLERRAACEERPVAQVIRRAINAEMRRDNEAA